MTTNQTIDGVPRNWAEIEAAIWGAFADGGKDYRGCTRERLRELRALLDAEPAPCAKSQVEPAVQPQGVPVAYRYKEGHATWENEKPWEPTTLAHGAVLLERKELAANGTFRANELEYYLALKVEPLYAEQPAPVAVVIKGGANLQGQSFIRNCQVTCCGSCPVGRTIGAIK